LDIRDVTTVEIFPREVREIENVWIPLSDGCRVAARIWLPQDAEMAPVPAILEYLPYRKRDFMRARDEPMHHYMAGHGYANVRVDIRGSGDSDGLLSDEYTEQELADALEVLRWIAGQPWCSGAIGMMGISWGGFNSLQVAALNPPELKAVISLCSTDDRYADDAHYMGGCLLNENLQWGSILMHYNAFPPDPDIVGERWRDMWLERLDNAVLFPARWTEHQHRDAYWQHGSVCEDFGAIKCAVYAIGGWADGYSNAVPRLLEGLSAPRKGLIGPWAHIFPHEGVPGPAIGFLQEALRWWDHWLKGVDTGIMDEPMLRAWMQESVPPEPYYEERPGRWVAEEMWPPRHASPRTFHLNPSRLDDAGEEEQVLAVSSPQTTGLAAGEWCAFGADGEMPIDQREDDGRSLTFDTPALEAPVEILGTPVVSLEVRSDRPSALIAVRLNDVAPDGTSTRVTYGLLNLTHRDGHDRPQPLEPSKRYQIMVKLNDIAHVFPAGHSIRLAISTSYWPIAWPSPEPAKITVHSGVSTLELPVREPAPGDAALPPFATPEWGPVREHVKLIHAPFRRRVERDLTTNELIYTLESDGGELGGAALAHIEAIGLDIGHHMRKRFCIGETDPLSARSELAQQTILRRGNWSIRVESDTRLSATATAFRIVATLTAFEGDKSVFERSWDEEIPRDLV
jgi:putative CocE/NonD family hydrolase